MKNKGSVQWVFDLDDTLYGSAENLRRLIVPRIKHVILERIGMPEKDYETERARLRHKTALKTNDTLLAFATAYGLPYEEMVRETYLSFPLNGFEIELRPGVKKISDLLGKKIVLSNAPRIFVDAILAHFGISSFFSEIIASGPDRYIHKPDASVFDLVQAGPRTIIVENEPENLRRPFELGWTTVWFPNGEVSGKIEPWIDRVIRSVEELEGMA